MVECNGRPTEVPTRYYGFPWQSQDFETLVPVGTYKTRELSNFYRDDGLGVAPVVVRMKKSHERFRHQRQQFAATVVLRPSPGGHGFVLELFDPLRVSATHVQVRVPVVACTPPTPWPQRLRRLG